LLATGYSEDIRKTGSEVAVLAKPFAVGDLSRAIGAVLSRRETDAA
jgi:hypothetical protein